MHTRCLVVVASRYDRQFTVVNLDQLMRLRIDLLIIIWKLIDCIIAGTHLAVRLICNCWRVHIPASRREIIADEVLCVTLNQPQHHA